MAYNNICNTNTDKILHIESYPCQKAPQLSFNVLRVPPTDGVVQLKQYTKVAHYMGKNTGKKQIANYY